MLYKGSSHKGGCSLLGQEVRETEAKLAKHSLPRVLLCHLGALFTLVAALGPPAKAQLGRGRMSVPQPGVDYSLENTPRLLLNKSAGIRALPETWWPCLLSPSCQASVQQSGSTVPRHCITHLCSLLSHLIGAVISFHTLPHQPPCM